MAAAIELRRLAATIGLLAICELGNPVAASAGELSVTVLDRDGQPVPDVAVYVDFPGDEASMADGKSAVMDQVGLRFVPHLLVVQTGTHVQFPNSDDIAHHVYSFSKPNEFILPLYKGDPHAPVDFSHEGLVTLGCNIHDQMLGYILVVASDVFGKTGADGSVRLEIGDRQPNSVNIWSPRLNTRKENLSLPLPAGDSRNLTFKLESRLRPVHHEERHSLEWSDY